MQFPPTMTSTWERVIVPRLPFSKQAKIRIGIFGGLATLSIAAVVWPKPDADPQIVVASVANRSSQSAKSESEAAKSDKPESTNIEQPAATADLALDETDPIPVEFATEPNPIDERQRVADQTAVLMRAAEDFAASLESAVLEDDLDKLRQRIDWISIIKKAAAGLPLEPAVVDGFADQLMSGLKGRGVDEQILDMVGHGGSYRFLNVRTEGDTARAMFRLVTPQGGFNYHEYHLEPSGDGLVASDVWIALSGETLSQSIHRSMLTLFKVHPVKDGEALDEVDREYIKNLWRLEQIATLMRTKPEDALHVMRQLPISLQKDKNILLARLTAAQAVSSNQYMESLKAYRKAFPNDAASELVSIDFHVLAGDFKSALQCIDRLDELVGGDGYLGLLRSGVHLAANDLVNAISSCQAAVQAEPGLSHAYWSLVRISLRERQYKLTSSLLTHLESRLGEKLGDLRGASEFRAFVESDEFDKWEQDRLLQ